MDPVAPRPSPGKGPPPHLGRESSKASSVSIFGGTQGHPWAYSPFSPKGQPFPIAGGFLWGRVAEVLQQYRVTPPKESGLRSAHTPDRRGCRGDMQIHSKCRCHFFFLVCVRECVWGGAEGNCCPRIPHGKLQNIPPFDKDTKWEEGKGGGRQLAGASKKSNNLPAPRNPPPSLSNNLGGRHSRSVCSVFVL